MLIDRPAATRQADPAFPYDLLSRHEVAQRLHCTPVTVTRSYARWGLKPVRIGGRVLFPAPQVLDLERRLIESGEHA